MPIRTELRLTNEFVGAVLLGLAAVVVLVVMFVAVAVNVRNSDNRKAETRRAEIEACANIENPAERILCLWDD